MAKNGVHGRQLAGSVHQLQGAQGIGQGNAGGNGLGQGVGNGGPGVMGGNGQAIGQGGHGQADRLWGKRATARVGRGWARAEK